MKLFYMNSFNTVYRKRQRSIYIRDTSRETRLDSGYALLYVPGPISTRWTYSLQTEAQLKLVMKDLKVKRVL